jgi:hypothetical protein
MFVCLHGGYVYRTIEAPVRTAARLIKCCIPTPNSTATLVPDEAEEEEEEDPDPDPDPPDPDVGTPTGPVSVVLCAAIDVAEAYL